MNTKASKRSIKKGKLFSAELMSWKNAYIKKYASEEEKLKIYELFFGELKCVLNVANMHNEMKITHNFCLAESIEMLRAAKCGGKREETIKQSWKFHLQIWSIATHAVDVVSQNV